MRNDVYCEWLMGGQCGEGTSRYHQARLHISSGKHPNEEDMYQVEWQMQMPQTAYASMQRREANAKGVEPANQR